jgi:hypothetical protein
VSANNQLRRPTQNGLIAFSWALLSMRVDPSLDIVAHAVVVGVRLGDAGRAIQGGVAALAFELSDLRGQRGAARGRGRGAR